MNESTEAVYEFIRKHWHEHGIGPTHREIADACYIGRSSVTHHLDRLEMNGKITRILSKARSIRLVDDEDDEGK